MKPTINNMIQQSKAIGHVENLEHFSWCQKSALANLQVLSAKWDHLASSHIYLSGSVTSLFILLSQSYIQYCSKVSKKSVHFRYNSKVIGLVTASYLQFTGRFLIKVINSAKGALLNCSLWIDLGTLW